MMSRAIVIGLLALVLWKVSARETPSSVSLTIVAPVTPDPAMMPTPRPTPMTTPAPPPPAVTPAPFRRTKCPAPRSDRAARPFAQPHGVSHVTTSLTNARWLAAWDAEHVVVSTDGGHSFHAALDGPGTVQDVAFDCFGHLGVLRDGKLGVRDGVHESWHVIPGMATGEDLPGAVIGGGPDLVVVGVGERSHEHARVAISSDAGATWWFRDLFDGWQASDATGREDPDGTIQLVLRMDAALWFRVAPDGAVEEDALGELDSVAIDGDRVLAVTDQLRWKHFGADDWHVIDGLGGELSLAAGPLPRVIAGDAVYAIDQGRARRLRSWNFGNGTAVDRAGRLWGLAETKDGEDAWLVTE